MEAKGKSQGHRTVLQKALQLLAEEADLSKPVTVELAIARGKCKVHKNGKWIKGTKPTSGNWKIRQCTAYQWYCKANCIVWEDRPQYHADQKTISVPTEEKVKALLNAARLTLSLKIEISGKTGLRPIEVTGEKGFYVKDFHADTKTITTINTKRCNARPPIPLGEELSNRLATYITVKHLKPNDHVFNESPATYGQSFRKLRARLAKKLADQSFMSIRLYDIRHYYVTKTLIKIGNAEIVRQTVGHKRLDTTQKYCHLTANPENLEWITEQTNDRKRADQLTKENWIYCYTTPDGYMQFKKAQ